MHEEYFKNKNKENNMHIFISTSNLNTLAVISCFYFFTCNKNVVKI